MKNKVIAAYVSFAITLLTLITIVVLYSLNEFNAKALLLNIFYSLFGGAFVTFVMSLFEYNNSKEETIDDFYDEYSNYLQTIDAIRYTNIGEKERIIADYCTYKDVYDSSQLAKIVQRLDELLARENLAINHNDIDKYLTFEGVHLHKNVVKTLNTYIDAMQFDLHKLWKIVSSMHFFNPLSRKFHSEAMSMYEDAETLLDELANNEERFQMFLDGDLKNLSEIVKDVEMLNNKVFRIELKPDGSQACFEEAYNCGQQ